MVTDRSSVPSEFGLCALNSCLSESLCFWLCLGSSVLFVNCTFTILSLEIVFPTSGLPLVSSRYTLESVSSFYKGKAIPVHPDVSTGAGHRREDRLENEQLERRKLGPGGLHRGISVGAGRREASRLVGRALRGSFLQEAELPGRAEVS